MQALIHSSLSWIRHKLLVLQQHVFLRSSMAADAHLACRRQRPCAFGAWDPHSLRPGQAAACACADFCAQPAHGAPSENRGVWSHKDITVPVLDVI